MTCISNKPYYIPQNQSGIQLVNSLGTGNEIELFWYQAYIDNPTFKLAYNIYFSTEEENVFKEGPKYLSTNLKGLYTKISNIFNPGDIYYFNIRATEYDPIWYNVNFLESSADGYLLKIYPETLLAANISAQSTIIPITDINSFPPMGIIQVGVELIKYSSKDIPNGTLVMAERGFLNSKITSHDTAGFDGYVNQDPIIRFFVGLEEKNTLINEEETKFNYPNFPYTAVDGYKQITQDLLNTDLSVSDAQQVNFPSYPANGYRMGVTQLALLLKGQCLDSYIGGESGCADDGYHSGTMIRNVSISDVNDQRQELLLSYTGEPVVLMKRLWKGISCSCVENNKESPESRCPKCFSSGFVSGFEQYYNPRDSSGRIQVRFGPYTDEVKQMDSGLESTITHDCWMITEPSLHERDVIIRFSADDTEEARYEVMAVVRNKILFGISGNQHFKAIKIRKTDIIYSWSAFRNTATMPHKVMTAVGLLKGPGNTFIPHAHQIVLNEHILAISQINQTTDVSNGHNHIIENGIIQPSPIDNHTHLIIF